MHNLLRDREVTFKTVASNCPRRCRCRARERACSSTGVSKVLGAQGEEGTSANTAGSSCTPRGGSIAQTHHLVRPHCRAHRNTVASGSGSQPHRRKHLGTSGKGSGGCAWHGAASGGDCSQCPPQGVLATTGLDVTWLQQRAQPSPCSHNFSSRVWEEAPRNRARLAAPTADCSRVIYPER